MHKSKSKQLTFEEEHNIAMSQKAFAKDPLQLDYSNWAYLYQSMKTRGLNQKQLKKHMNKYSQTVLTTLQNTHQLDRSRSTIKQKLTQLNHQLRIRLSQVFQFISMLHMEILQQIVQYIFGGFMSTIQRMAEVFEEMREGMGRLEGEVESWKFKKRNVLCFACQNNLQQSKMRNLQQQISTTSTTSTITSLHPLSPTTQTHQQPRSQKMSSQCKTLQTQLQSISQQHFFTLQSDDLVSKINQVLKTRIITSEKHESKDTTSGMLASCLNQLNEVVRPFDIEYGAGKDEEVRELVMKKGRKRATIIEGNALLIGDLNDKEVFTSKLMTLFAQPLHRFVLKYQTLLSNKCPNEQQTSTIQPLIQLIDQQTQTSLIKQPQAIRNLQKRLISQNRQLSLLKATKQKIDKDLYTMYDTLKDNQTVVIQITSKNKLLQQQNKVLQKQLKQLKNIIANNEAVLTAQKQLIFKSFSQQKSQLTNQLSKIQKQLQLYRQSGIQKSQKTKRQHKQVQTYKSSFQNYQPSIQRSTQTGIANNTNNNNNNNYLIPFKIDKRGRHQRTFRSFKLKSNNINQKQQLQQYYENVQRSKEEEEFSNNNHSNEQIISTIDLPERVEKRKFNKTRIELPMMGASNDQDKLFQSAKHFPAIQQQEDAKMMMNKTLQYRSIHQLFGKRDAINDSQSSIIIDGENTGNKKKKKNKQIHTSINSMIPQKAQACQSYTPSRKITPRNRSLSLQSQSHSDTENNTIFNDPPSKSNIHVSGTKLNLSKQDIDRMPQISQPKIQISAEINKQLKSSSRLKDVYSLQEEVERRPNEKNRLVIHNFNQISTIFENNDIDQILVSKLKKVSKQQLIKQSSTTGNKIFRKSIFPTTNQTPTNESVQNLLQINQLPGKQNHNSSPYKINITQLSSSLQKQLPADTFTIQSKSRKQRIIDFINENYEYLQENGVINMVEESEKKAAEFKLGKQVKENTPLNQLREILKRSQLQKLAQHIQKSDIQLFISLQQSTKYENRAGLWNQYEATMMLDNNFIKIIQQIDAFFNYLKSNRKTSYNEYVVFLGRPNKFMKEIVDQQNYNLQKQRVLKEVIKVQKTNAPINKKWFIKETFKKLVRVHKALHKGGCNHVEKFLEKIGFYDFQSKNKTINQRSLQKNRSDEDKPILTKNPLSIPKGLKM